ASRCRKRLVVSYGPCAARAGAAGAAGRPPPRGPRGAARARAVRGAARRSLRRRPGPWWSLARRHAHRDAAVLGAARFGVVRRHRVLLAVALGLDAVSGDRSG